MKRNCFPKLRMEDAVFVNQCLFKWVGVDLEFMAIKPNVSMADSVCLCCVIIADNLPSPHSQAGVCSTGVDMEESVSTTLTWCFILHIWYVIHHSHKYTLGLRSLFNVFEDLESSLVTLDSRCHFTTFLSYRDSFEATSRQNPLSSYNYFTWETSRISLCERCINFPSFFPP